MAVWAKSSSGYTPPTLAQHTADVKGAFQDLFGRYESPTRLAICWSSFFRLPSDTLFHATATAALLFHDWGKANDGFQNSLRRASMPILRHEHLSGLLMTSCGVWERLVTVPGIDWEVALGAVISHHLKGGYEEFGQLHGEQDSLSIPLQDADYRDYIDLIARELGVAPEHLEVPPLWGINTQANRLDRAVKRAKGILRPARHEMQAIDGPRNRLMMAVRSAVIVADAVGSARPRIGISIAEWLQNAFDPDRLCTEAGIWDQVISPRLNDLRRRGLWKDSQAHGGWLDFQIQCDDLPERSLLLAPCGSGKTLGAWRAIARRCRTPAKRVIFLYPTRATATEGFRDYVSWAPESDAALLHGTANYDLNEMFASHNEEDPRRHKSFEVDPRLFALGVWTKQIFSATVDQFLGFMANSYSSTCLLPLLVDSVIVIDEVHSFDRSLFAALEQFLTLFDVPVLCMTATLSQARRKQLQECGLAISDSHPDDLRNVAHAPRYTVGVESRDNLIQKVVSASQAGQSVLWVANTVEAAQQIFLELQTRVTEGTTANGAVCNVPVYCYHSRFRLFDRVQRHQEVVRAVTASRTGGVVAVTTQVCEMSLDLDADLLVSAVAPIPAMIQRMGRCNRQRIPRCAAGAVWFYQPETHLPYKREQLRGTAGFLKDLTAKPRVSQADLENALATHMVGEDLLLVDCSFPGCGPFASSLDFTLRELDEFTIDAVLDVDVATVTELRRHNKPIAGYFVPVPRSLASRPHPPFDTRFTVAPASHYNDRLGFSKLPVAELKGSK
jgi:CRISPR-associated endonuclease/helicase Cas3